MSIVTAGVCQVEMKTTHGDTHGDTPLIQDEFDSRIPLFCMQDLARRKQDADLTDNHRADLTHDEMNVLVYDTDGGSLDVSIMSDGDGQAERKTTDEDTHLGEENIDSRILLFCMQDFARKNDDANLTDNHRATPRSSQIDAFLTFLGLFRNVPFLSN